MKIKLLSFYEGCILPEPIEPQHTRNLPTREPQYIKDAIENKRKNHQHLNMTRKMFNIQVPKKMNINYCMISMRNNQHALAT